MKRSFLSYIKTPFFRVMSFVMGAVFAAGLVTMFAVNAVHTTSDEFELGPNHDGVENANIVDDGPDNAVVGDVPDWASLFNADGSLTNSDGLGDPDAIDVYGGATAVFIMDDLSSSGLTDDTTFASSNKNNDPIQDVDSLDGWNWDSGNNPPKDDISNAYAYAEVVNNELIMYVGLERLAPNGDSHVDFEFNQVAVGLDKDPPCGDDETDGLADTEPCEFTGEKTDNDLLVVMDFERGGALGFVEFRRWDTKGNADPSDDEYVLVDDLNGEGCLTDDPGTATNEADAACAFNNATDIDGGPWDNFDRHGNVITDLPQNAFTEIGVNVTRLLGLTPCFNSINAKSRTSQSFNSELKDFAAEAFELCRATVATEIHAGSSADPGHDTTDIQSTTVPIPVGTLIHDLAIVTGTGVPGVPDPTGSVDFTLYEGLTCEGAVVQEWLDVALDIGTAGDGISTAESGNFDTLGQPGDYSFSASYSGDSNFPPAALAGDDCEPIIVERLDSKTVTEIHLKGAHSDIQAGVGAGSVDVGTEIHDFAEVTEFNDTAGAPTPTGTVTFRFFAGADCSDSDEVIGSVSGTTYPLDRTLGVDTPLAANTAETPDLVTQAGALSFEASYGGDDNYNGSSESGCENLTVNKLVPTLATTIHDASHGTIALNSSVPVGTLVHDLATVTGTGPDPTGTVDFTLYSNLTCEAGAENVNVVLTWDDVSLAVGTVGDGVSTADSTDNFPAFDTLAMPGNYSFSISYSGDTVYEDAVLSAAHCEPFKVHRLDSKTVTEIHLKGAHSDIQAGVGAGSVDVGTEIHDFAEVTELNDTAGAPTPTGTVTFRFFAGAECSDSDEVKGSVSGTTYPLDRTLGVHTPLAANTAETPDLVTQAGALSFEASYGGDNNYNGSSESGCENLTVNKLVPELRTEIHAGDSSVAHDMTDLQIGVGAGEVTVGTLIHDFVEVSGTGADPTGLATFTLYDNLTCDGTVVDTWPNVGLDVGSITNDGISTAESGNFDTTGQPGDYSFTVSYGGDSIYEDADLAAEKCEAITVVGADGCTPGYWRNHLDSWPATGYSPGQLYDDVFGVNLFPGQTLEEVVNQSGGDLNQLGFHSVAGLLSAAHPDVGYPFSEADVIALVQAVEAGAITASEAKNQLAAANELGCPID